MPSKDYASIALKFALPKAKAPTDTVLNRFEKEHGNLLPETYREFCKRFGAGELSGYYRIYCPSPNSSHDLWTQHLQTLGTREENLNEEYGTYDELLNYLFFGDTIGGEWFGWNLNDVTKTKPREYAVYYFWRRGDLERIADNFRDFIFDHCLTPRKNWDPENEFWRYQAE